MVTIRRMESALALALVAAAASGCATKGFVRSEIAQARGYTDTRVEEAKTEAQAGIQDARTRADQAMEKATLAEKLASGAVDYTEVASYQVQFDFDDYRLDDDANAMLDQAAGSLTSHPRYVLEIRGFADATGSDRYNLKLGRERADAVLRDLMSRHMVPSTRVAIVSFGEESPLADNSTRDGRAQNRRVQVRVLETKVPGEPLATAQ